MDAGSSGLESVNLESMSTPKSDATRKLGEKLVAARGQASQQDVADAAAIHVSNYGQYERGETEIGLHMLVRVSHVLGMTPAELLEGITDRDVPAIPDLPTAFDVRDARARQRELLRSNKQRAGR